MPNALPSPGQDYSAASDRTGPQVPDKFVPLLAHAAKACGCSVKTSGGVCPAPPPQAYADLPRAAVRRVARCLTSLGAERVRVVGGCGWRHRHPDAANSLGHMTHLPWGATDAP